MNGTPETLTVLVEREIAHPPERIWRALTQAPLIGEWLMRNDFVAEQGRRFTLAAEWGKVDCQVREIRPHECLCYAWNTKDLRSIVRWTLTPTDAGTLLRMEQTGFTADQKPYHMGARAGWPRFMTALERLLERMA